MSYGKENTRYARPGDDGGRDLQAQSFRAHEHTDTYKAAIERQIKIAKGITNGQQVISNFINSDIEGRRDSTHAVVARPVPSSRRPPPAPPRRAPYPPPRRAPCPWSTGAASPLSTRAASLPSTRAASLPSTHARVLPTALPLRGQPSLLAAALPYLLVGVLLHHPAGAFPFPRAAPSSAAFAPPPSPLTPSASSPSSSSLHSFLPFVPLLPSSTSFPSASATWLRVTGCHLVIVTLLPPHTPVLHPPPPLLSPSISPTFSPLPPPLFSPYLLQLLRIASLVLLL
ncbi:unnamed protein product [Closterium sp. Naga37s-1]|nr:unnamed protein product [Closterium sp. Naga37s-1]